MKKNLSFPFHQIKFTKNYQNCQFVLAVILLFSNRFSDNLFINRRMNEKKKKFLCGEFFLLKFDSVRNLYMAMIIFHILSNLVPFHSCACGGCSFDRNISCKLNNMNAGDLLQGLYFMCYRTFG